MITYFKTERMRKLLLAGLVIPFLTNAQIDLGTPMCTGKGGVATAITHDWQAIGVNPANLGYEDNYKFSMGLTNFGFSLQSKAIDLTRLSNAIMKPNEKFTLPEKQELATKFATPDGLNLYANVNIFAASIYFPKLGGIAVNLRDRISGHATLGQNTSDIIFNGVKSVPYQDPSVYSKYISQVFDGTHISYYHYRELNLAYGRKIIGKEDAVELFGGAGAKYLWGLADMDFKSENGQISGRAAFSSDYGFDFGAVKNFKPTTSNVYFNTVGHGFAFDLGTGIKVKNKFTLAASVTDVGSISWAKNTLIVIDTTMPHLDTSQLGLSSFDPNSIAGFLYNSITGMVHYTDAGAYTTSLPTRFRVGTGLKLGKKVLIGADVVMPVTNNNGDLQNAFFAFGGEVTLWKKAKFSTGISGNQNYGFSVPVGFTLGSMGITEFYIATNDIITYISKSKNPQISFAMAVLRINIKKPGEDDAK